MDALFELQRRDRGTPGSPKPGRPFDARLEESTWLKYRDVWRRVICTFTRYEETEGSEPEPYRATRAQLAAHDAWAAEVKGWPPHPTKEAVESADRKCLAFLILLLRQKLGGSAYKSPLICALAILGIRPDGTWVSAQDYTPTLSAFVKIARMLAALDAFYERKELLARHARDRTGSEENSDDDYASDHSSSSVPSMFSLVRARVAGFLARVSSDRDSYPTPMDWVLDARTYGLKIRYSTPARGTIQWERDILRHRSITLTVADLSEACHQVVTEAEGLLLEACHCDSVSALPRIPWRDLRDDHSDAAIGYSFLSDPRNEKALEHGREFILRRITADPYLQRAWVGDATSAVSEGRPRIRFRPAQAEWLFGIVQQLRERLWVLMHLTSGQPARTTEVMSLRVANTQNGHIRNLFVEQGALMWVTLYHKGFRASAQAKVIYRYLPRSVGQLFIWYLWLLLPFSQIVTSEVREGERLMLNPMLWARSLVTSEDSSTVKLTNTKQQIMHQVWNGDTARRIIRQAGERTMGQPLNISGWRQIAIAIANRYLVGGSHSRKGLFEGDCSDQSSESDDDGARGLTLDDIAVVKQSGHGAHVGSMIYARGIEEASFGTTPQRNYYRAASSRWHRLLGFGNPADDSTQGPGLSRPSVWSEERRSALERRLQVLKNTNWRLRLREFAGPTASFRGLQGRALGLVSLGFPRLAYVAGTGSGKSLLFMLPAFAVPSGTTVVITPLVALQDDLLRRCQAAGISAQIWQQSGCPPASIVFVTPESAVSVKFTEFAARLLARQQLDRVVVDECHVILHSTHTFRPLLQRLGTAVTQWGVQELYLSATLPPSDEHRFAAAIHVPEASIKWVRSSTGRPNIRYKVVLLDEAKAKAGEDVMQGAVINAVRQWQQQAQGGRMVVYAPTVAEVVGLGAVLGCPTLHAKAGSREEKGRRVRAWAQGADDVSRVIVATSALGMGIDVPDVTLVVHAGMPRQLQDFAQESGRAGRSGAISESVVLCRRSQPPTQYIEPGVCRRVALDTVLDQTGRSEGCLGGEEPCDTCEEARQDADLQALLHEAEGARTSSPEPWPVTAARRAAQQGRLQEAAKAQLAAKEAADFEVVARRWANTCVLCWQLGHGWSTCTSPGVRFDQEDFRDHASTLEVNMFNRRRFKPYSCCFGCGLPQSICQRFEASEHDFSHRSPTGTCSFAGLLPVLFAGLLCAESDNPMEILDSSPWKADGYATPYEWFGLRIQWGHLVTNNLCRFLYSMYKSM